MNGEHRSRHTRGAVGSVEEVGVSEGRFGPGRGALGAAVSPEKTFFRS